MNPRSIILTLAVATAFAAQCAAPFLHIFRNNQNFNTFRLDSLSQVVHTASESGWLLDILKDEDRLASIPLECIDSVQFRPSDIPTIYYDLVDYPDAKNLWDKELYMKTFMRIDGNGYCEDMSGLELNIKGRGNSTWYPRKKPIRLKFDKKTQLFDFTKAKSYVLLANYFDFTLCRNALAFYIARRLDFPYANSTVPCNVVLNGNDLGTYLLTEKIGINKASVDIDEENGILFELSDEYDEKYKFHSACYGLPVMVKDPDFDELTESNPEITPEERFRIWKEDFEEAERAVASGNGWDYFDLDNFVDYYLLNNLCSNHEIGIPKSEYMYKTETGTGVKYRHGPVWDFDIAFTVLKSMEDDGLANVRNPLRLNKLDLTLTQTAPFREKYKLRLNQFINEIYPDLEKWLDDYASLIRPAAKRDGLLYTESYHNGWCYRISCYDAEFHLEILKEYLRERIEFMKEEAVL